MKKIITILLVVFSISLLSSCQNEEVESINLVPEASKMSAICELAVLDCYFNNVAKFSQEDAEGWWLWSKDKHFWVEYSGIVSVGIDASLASISVDGEHVTITIPKAKILSSKVDNTSLTEDSFYIAKGSANIDAEDEVLAFEVAQTEMLKTASNDTSLLMMAEDRTKTLLTDYVNNISDITGINYIIEWNVIDNPIE